ncbi:hypothetical protein [Paenibacillus sp. YN15]|uniref:hypothetical protein n=1 Tax=Paenibacillus sp. YN15 TaxID=1742774 RepID=UPI0011BECADF|nr:hypothetical protein [Paenibacillus sp. YN15]
MWVISEKNSLTYDDFTLLAEARFTSYENLFSFFPQMSYNDRPIRMLFNKLLNDLFGLNYTLYHLVFVFIHLINVYIVYRIGLKIFNVSRNGLYSAILSAAIFGIYPTSLMAVSWISATADLLCCLFSLLCILFYLKSQDKNLNHYSVFYSILALLFYYLSLRSKEMSLLLPIILILYELGKAVVIKRKINFNWCLGLHFLLMIVFSWFLFTGGLKEIPLDNPYYQDFHISVLIRNTIRYLFLYFDLTNSGFTFYSYSVSSIIGVLLFIYLFILSCYLLLKKRNPALLISLICIGISISVVLPMVNMQHRLYLYIPSIFIGFSVGFSLELLSGKKRNLIWEALVILIPLIYIVSFSPGMVNYRLSWLGNCQKDAFSIKQILKIDKPVRGSNVYIKGASSGYNIFFYGPGNSLRLLFDDPSLKPILVEDFPEVPESPYLFLEYSDGEVKDLQRNNTISKEKFEIISVYPSLINKNTVKLNADNSLNIGVTSSIINENLEIYVNGQAMKTTIGKEFISTVVPKEELEKPFLIIYVKDKLKGIKTDEVKIMIISY